MTTYNEWIVNSKLDDDMETKITLLTAELVSKIVRRRKELGLTQEELGKRANLSQSQIARLENGSQIPRLDTVIRAALALNMRVTFVNDIEASISNDEQVADREINYPKLRKLFAPEHVRAIVELADAIKEMSAIYDKTDNNSVQEGSNTKLRA